MKRLLTPIFNKSIILILVLLSSLTSLHAQTVVRGVVTDAKTKQPMSYVTVAFTGTTQGIGTNGQGSYTLSTTDNAINQIKVSFVGYRTAVRNITPGQDQTINIALTEDNHSLNEVVVKSAKKKNTVIRITLLSSLFAR